MTILMTADAVGGVWTYALDLSRGVGIRGVRVVLAVMGGPLSDDQRRAAESVPGLSLAAKPYKLEWMDEPWADVEAAGGWLLNLAREVSADVVHLNGFAHGALPFHRPVLVAAHSCVLSWFEAVRSTAPPPEWRPYEVAVKRGLGGASVIVTPSRAMAVALIRHYGPQPPVVPIYNGRDPSAAAPAAKGDFVFAAGRVWDEAKNLAQLAAVAPAIRWPIFVAGDGSQQLAGINALGRLSPATLGHWYGHASIFVLPARYEPFGLAAVEAGLAGCALVLGDIPSLREVWDDAALFVHPDDTKGLAAALSALIEQQTLRQRMARLARARATRYSAAAMAGAYLAVYQRLAATPGARSRRFACAS
jgi:glycosyltransferase involved in cell wall biosynthesis